MIIKEIIQKLHTTMVDARCQESHFESWLTQNEGICDAIDMLKELAKQEQGEPVALPILELDGIALSPNVVEQIMRWGQKCASTPQQRTWVGLTDEDIRPFCKESWVFDTVKQWSEIIEAKLKEKNT